ncbi:MAG: helix-turn-helix transcriptional regulator [Bacteroidales bacterium]|nr:helix-turn-helix transcriptional regulator [Lachnoclostridium sp.]MCM1384706.1 helix-turn-helix transcriptional regulator [Lachnoclostridium sp.]MCM1465280.1 helix-turn-helix transcriptional regulator [Bacteroidales bacterium]
MKNTLYTINQYGKILIDIKTIMDKKGISRNMLARAIHARFEVIDKWYNGHVEKIDADVLARICFVLECTPGDIIRYSETD